MSQDTQTKTTSQKNIVLPLEKDEHTVHDLVEMRLTRKASDPDTYHVTGKTGKVRAKKFSLALEGNSGDEAFWIRIPDGGYLLQLGPGEYKVMFGT